MLLGRGWERNGVAEVEELLLNTRKAYHHEDSDENNDLVNVQHRRIESVEINKGDCECRT